MQLNISNSDAGEGVSTAAKSLIVVAASQAGIEALRRLLPNLSGSLLSALIIVQHIPPGPSFLVDVLQRRTTLPVKWAEEGEVLRPGTIYVAPPDHHIVLESPGIVRLNKKERIHFVRPSADPLFASAARVFGKNVFGMVLTGRDSDASGAVKEIMQAGGKVYVQNPETCIAPEMPRATINACVPTDILSLKEMGKFLASVH